MLSFTERQKKGIHEENDKTSDKTNKGILDLKAGKRQTDLNNSGFQIQGI